MVSDLTELTRLMSTHALSKLMIQLLHLGGFVHLFLRRSLLKESAKRVNVFCVWLIMKL